MSVPPPPPIPSNNATAPVPWIGLYIAVASLVCTLAMVADLLHGFRSRKFWFPCKYFTLNAATMTVIAVAMKLPVDLTTNMDGSADQYAKISGVALMCAMMANFMPSLGTMDNTELLLNMIALVILVVTLTVNVCIEIGTGIVDIYGAVVIVIFYIFCMLVLLLISASLALSVPTTKRILEWKYHKMHTPAQDDDQHGEKIVEKLTRNVRKYWMMAETGNPLFVMSSSPACSAAGAICLLVSFLQLILAILELPSDVASRGFEDMHGNTIEKPHYHSDYKWSVKLILVIQSIGVGVGSIAPIFRLFAALNFKLSIKWSKNEMKVFRVENYWFKLLQDWKRNGKALQKIRGRRCKKLAHVTKNLILNICIVFQILVVVMCKVVRFSNTCIIVFIFFIFYCLGSLKTKLVHFLCTPSTSNVPSRSQPIGRDSTKTDHIRIYVVQLQDEVEIAERTLKSISKAVDRLVKKAEKNCPRHLIDLLRKHSTRLDGVSKFEIDEIPPLHSEEVPSCWSLAIVTLTSIAIALLKDGSSVDRLLKSINEGLIYVNHIEENLNIGSNLSEARTAANQVWLGVDLDKVWLGNSLRGMDSQGKTPMEILLWLVNTATNIMAKFKNSENGCQVGEFNYEFIAANSMYKISHTLLFDVQYRSHGTAVEGLEVMISDILSACLTNIPRVINIKCHTATIEKREESIRAAATLLGETKEILEILEDVQSPALDPDQMACLNQWRRASLKRQNLVDPVMQTGSEALTLAMLLSST